MTISTKRSATLLGSAIALALVVTGCSAQGDNTADAPAETVTIATMFGDVEVPQGDDLTIVALGWSDAETALALGVKPVAVFDWQAFGEETSGVGPWAADLFDGEQPTVIANTGEALNYEQIQGFEPDVILNLRSDNSEETFERLSEIAPTVYGPEGAPAYALSWQEQTSTIGEVLGKSDEAASLISDVEAQIGAAVDEHPEFQDVPAAVASKFGDAYGASFPGDARWDVLGDLGFTLEEKVAALEPTEGFYAPISIEQIGALDTSVLVMFPIFLTLDELTSDPLVSALPVVQENRAVFLEPDGDIVNAFSAGSILSVPVAVEGIVPLLADAVAAQ